MLASIASHQGEQHNSLEGQNLDGVGDEQTGPGKSICHTVEPEERDDSDTSSLVASLAVLRAGDSRAHEADQHTTSGSQEQRTSANSVAQKSARDRNDERENFVAAVKTQTSPRAVNASGSVDLVSVVTVLKMSAR